jgi:CubicO group peptidase (beta-lactamase class C family)
MTRRVAHLIGVVLLLFPTVAQAFGAATPEEVGLSRERLARIAPAMARQIEAKSFPGAVVVVARKGRIAYFEAIGQLDPKTGTPMSRDAIFRLYSMTKPFTSVAAMMLVEDGRLRLTDPVGLYLPPLAKLEVLTQGTTVAAERPVTV